MPESHQPNSEDLNRLIEAGLEAATYIPLRQVLAPQLIVPFIRMLAWPYSKPQVEFPCWIIADLSFHRQGLTLAYSANGHGSRGDPWGIVLSSDTWFGRDDSWFTCLEDAFISSGAWTQTLPPEFEIRSDDAC
jgi:hypothetical protein